MTLELAPIPIIETEKIRGCSDRIEHGVYYTKFSRFICTSRYIFSNNGQTYVSGVIIFKP
jgi:hypothetical protein